MVKLNDLEELAEPLLGGAPGVSTSRLAKDEVMDLDDGDRLQEEVNVAAQFSPDEANIGLL